MLKLSRWTRWRCTARWTSAPAKPTAEDRSAIAHHLIDIVDPDQAFSVACFLRAAHQAVAEIRGRGRNAILVGGTPMYVKSVLRGFDPGPPADWDFRRQVAEDVRDHGLGKLRERLLQVDPLSAHRLHPNDERRMTRALEVARLTGEPLSHRQMQFEQQRLPHQCKVFACSRPRDILHERINERVIRMFDAGLVAEAEQLRQQYVKLSHTAAKAVGYAEVFEHLDGHVSLDETITSVQTHTRQLARRQETFLRSFGERRIVELHAADALQGQCERVLAMAAV